MNDKVRNCLLENIDLIRSKDFRQLHEKVYDYMYYGSNTYGNISELYQYLYLDKKIDVLSGNAILVPNSFMYHSEGIISVDIPDNIEVILGYAFAKCENLVSVHMGDKIRSIGSSAFHDCLKLKEIVVPYSTLSIGRHAFTSCPKLTKVKLPNNGLKDFMKEEGLNKFVDDPSIIEWY